MIEVIFTVGMQASGKSTWAKEFVKEHQDYKRVSRDDIRHMTNGYVFNKQNEKLVTEIERNAIHGVLASNFNLVIDKMNLNEVDRAADVEFVKHVCNLNGIKDVNIVFKEFPVTLDEALRRDKNRDFPIGAKVLQATWSKYQETLVKMLNIPEVPYNHKLAECIIVDVDGTLADRGSRNAFDFKRVKEDTVKPAIRRLVDDLSLEGNDNDVTRQVIIFSGRDDSCMEDTKEWLRENKIHFDEIYMRKTGDKRKDSIVKKELYENHVKERFNVAFWVDDRRQVIDMVRFELGLTCLDVAGHDF